MAATKFNVAPTLSVPFQTTDATPTVAAYFDATQYPLCGFFFEVKIVARDATGSVAATYWRQAAFRSSSTGALTQVGSTRTVVTDNEDSSGMDVSVAVGSTSQIQVTVTGVAATTINWVLDNTIRVTPFGP